MATPERIVYFDGLCGLCDKTVDFLLRHDRRGVLHFATLQGEHAQRLRERHAGLPGADDSLLLAEAEPGGSERVRYRSDAVLAAVAALGGVWRAAAVLRIVPRIVRDATYDFIARRRTRWFGRLPSCRIPTPAERARFLD